MHRFRLAAMAMLLLALACGGQQGLTTQQAPPPAPTAKATPTPAPTPVQPITLSGTGSKVTDPIDIPIGFWRLAWKAEGTGNFIVQGHGQSDSVLVNVILPSPSSGEVPFQSLSGRFVLSIQADQASWMITLTRVSA